MSFFIRNRRKSRQDAKKQTTVNEDKRKAQKRSHKSMLEDEEISSDSEVESDDVGGDRKEEYSSNEEDIETAQEKRLRLAKEYLSQLDSEKQQEADDTYDSISKTLKDDLLEQRGKLHREVANTFSAPGEGGMCMCRGHQLSLTCLVISPDSSHVFTASKDCSIIKWCMESKKKATVIPGGRKGTEDKHIGHTDHVLSLAISSDNKFLVSGDRNKLIYVWNPVTCERLHILKGHRDAVSGLAFRRGAHQLFSASHDRTIKTWNLDEMAYVETLFGHQDVVTGIDCLSQERAVSCGGRDGSVRLWKIIDESQLVFHGHTGSIDCISFINENHFVSGADDNSIAIWGTLKKKPLVTVKPAHPAPTPASINPWITAVTALKHTDLIASGSHDGSIRLWRCADDFRALHPIFSIPLVGFVNGLAFGNEGRVLVAAVGQEHRLGRWSKVKNAKNCVCILTLGQRSADEVKKLTDAQNADMKLKQPFMKQKPFKKNKNTKRVIGKIQRGNRGKRML